MPSLALTSDDKRVKQVGDYGRGGHHADQLIQKIRRVAGEDTSMLRGVVGQQGQLMSPFAETEKQRQ